LIERLIYRVKQKEELTGKKKENIVPVVTTAPTPATASTSVKTKFDEKPATFKAGSSLPALDDDEVPLQQKA
jgi:hypothetical protein